MSANTEKKPEELKVTKDMIIADIIEKYPNTMLNFIESGMICVTCPVSQMETLEEAVAVHGIPLDGLLRDLNRTANGENPADYL